MANGFLRSCADGRVFTDAMGRPCYCSDNPNPPDCCSNGSCCFDRANARLVGEFHQRLDFDNGQAYQIDLTYNMPIGSCANNFFILGGTCNITSPCGINEDYVTSVSGIGYFYIFGAAFWDGSTWQMSFYVRYACVDGFPITGCNTNSQIDMPYDGDFFTTGFRPEGGNCGGNIFVSASNISYDLNVVDPGGFTVNSMTASGSESLNVINNYCCRLSEGTCKENATKVDGGLCP